MTRGPARNLQVADKLTRTAANELLLRLCPTQPALAPAAGARWKTAGMVVTTAAAVAAAPAAPEAKTPKLKSVADAAPPPDAADAAAAAAIAEKQKADDLDLEQARAFWKSWTDAKGDPEPKYWTPEQVWMWCVRRAPLGACEHTRARSGRFRRTDTPSRPIFQRACAHPGARYFLPEVWLRLQKPARS